MKSAMNRAFTCYLAFSRYDDNIKLGILSFNFFFLFNDIKKFDGIIHERYIYLFEKFISVIFILVYLVSLGN